MIDTYLASLQIAVDEYDAEVERVTATRNTRREELVRGLKARRVDAGISLREMARRIECSAATLSDIEHGRRWSDRLTLAYARALHAERASA